MGSWFGIHGWKLLSRNDCCTYKCFSTSFGSQKWCSTGQELTRTINNIHFCHFLLQGVPCWTKEDDDKLNSSDPKDIQDLCSTYGQEAVMKRQAFFNWDQGKEGEREKYPAIKLGNLAWAGAREGMIFSVIVAALLGTVLIIITSTKWQWLATLHWRGCLQPIRGFFCSSWIALCVMVDKAPCFPQSFVGWNGRKMQRTRH